MTLEELRAILAEPTPKGWNITGVKPCLSKGWTPPPRDQASAIRRWRNTVSGHRSSNMALMWPAFKGWASTLVGFDAPPEWRIEGGYEALCNFYNGRSSR